MKTDINLLRKETVRLHPKRERGDFTKKAFQQELAEHSGTDVNVGKSERSGNILISLETGCLNCSSSEEVGHG